MDSMAIRIENLGKKYTIAHEERQRYVALRDVIADRSRRIGRTILSPLRRGFLPASSQSREDFWALRDVSFEIKQGDRVGIIGRNGAGKSTLLKLLARITEPTTGRITLRGRVASLLEVGTGFHPELTGRENIFLNGAILGMSKQEIKSKFDEIVDFAEIEKFLDTPVKRYSSGMYVRLAFAVAAHLEPEILLVDEVLAVGDAQFQKKCLGKMEDVSAREGRTVLVVSHQMPMIQQLCVNTILFESGRLKMIGSTSKAISEYLSTGLSETDLVSSTFEANTEVANKAAPYFILEKIALTDNRNNEIYPIVEAGREEICFTVKGFVEKEDILFNVGFMLFDEMNNTLMLSYHTDQPPEKWPRLLSGPICLRASVDISGLNEGRYRFDLIASLHCVKMLFTPEDKISLYFEIVGNQGGSPYWIGRRNSILAPLVPWERIT